MAEGGMLEIVSALGNSEFRALAGKYAGLMRSQGWDGGRE